MENNKKKVFGFIAGAWDLLHPGHLVTLAHAKKNCDQLIVALKVNPDKKHSVEKLPERYLRLQACKFVDFIIPYETEEDSEQIIKIWKPEVQFLGEEYKNSKETITGYSYTVQYGGTYQFVDRSDGYSSSSLRNRIYFEEKNRVERQVKNDLPF